MKLESLLLLLLLSLLRPAASSPTDLYKVRAICEKANHPGQCRSLVNSMVPGLTTSEPTTILQLHMKAAAVNTQAALRHARAILDDSKTGPAEKPILGTCISAFGSAAAELEEANEALERHDTDRVKRHVRSVLTYSVDCANAYKDGKLETPLKGYGDLNKQLISNGLALVDSFWPPSPSPSPSSTVALQSYGSEEDPLTDDYSALLTPSTTYSSSFAPSDEVKAICDKAVYPDICMSSIQSVSSGPLESNDAATVLQLMIKDTIFTTQAAIDRAKVFAKASETDQRTKDILVHKCVREYKHALNDLEEATEAIAINDKEEIKAKLVGLIHRYSTCEDAFEEAQLDSPMGEYKHVLKQLAENNLAVATSFCS